MTSSTDPSIAVDREVVSVVRMTLRTVRLARLWIVTMFDTVTHVVRMCSVREVCHRVVQEVAVKVTNLKPDRLWAKEGARYDAVQPFGAALRPAL